MIDLAAGQNTTFFIARPPATAAELAAASIPAPATASNATTTASTPAPAIASNAEKTASVDLSGFGSAFAPPVSAVVVTQKAVLPKPDTGISRTEQDPWEALARYPYLDDEEVEGADNCRICGKEDDATGGDALECEMVSLRALLPLNLIAPAIRLLESIR